MTDSQARAMTGQPAQPRPGPITCHLCGETGLSSVGMGSKYKHNILKCVPEMAAERDRLLKVNTGLVKALKKTLAKGCECLVCTGTRAALHEATL